VEYLAETSVIHLQDFTSENPADSKEKYEFYENLRTKYVTLLVSVAGTVFIMDLESKITSVRLI